MATLLAHGFTRIEEAPKAYDAAGETYLRYADGDVAKLFDFSGRYSAGDPCFLDRAAHVLLHIDGGDA